MIHVRIRERVFSSLVLLSFLASGLISVTLHAQTATAPVAVAARTSGTEWWKRAVIYEVYPRSFQDSNGDGIGDLNGITDRLDYLQALGVDAIWLSPIYPSPQVDFGYDISNYEAIDPQYGTLADFDKLVAEAKKRNIRVIMDMVLNHTSDKHPWFEESKSSKTNAKRDWYVWRDGKGQGSSSQQLGKRIRPFGVAIRCTDKPVVLPQVLYSTTRFELAESCSRECDVRIHAFLARPRSGWVPSGCHPNAF